jgi:AraC family transcriptional regulator
MKPPKIREVKSMKVVYIQTVGEYGKQQMKDSWEKLFAFIKKHKLFSFNMDCIGIGYDDPTRTEPSKCRYEACIRIKKDASPEGEVGVKTVEGGKYAVFMHRGPYDKLGNVYKEIYQNWIPENKIEVRKVPPFEKYLNSPNITKPENLKTEIFIAIV